MPRTRRPRSAFRAFLDLLWQQPFWALPFALFFGTLYGGGWPGYWRAYRASLLFAYTIALTLWVVQHTLMRRLQSGSRRLSLWGEIATYTGAAVLASMLAALIGDFTLMPGMLGNARSVKVTTVYA